MKDDPLEHSFHDGSIIAIRHFGSEIQIAMERTELSSAKNIKGILTLSGVRKLELDGRASKDPLAMKADSATILDFEVKQSRVHLFVEWVHYPKSDLSEQYTDIVVDANSLNWEDAPDLFDPYNIAIIEKRFVVPIIVLAAPSMKEKLNDPLLPTYVALSALAHHVVNSFKAGDLSEFPRIFNLIERLHVDGDDYVREAATIGFLEAVQNLSAQPDSGIDSGVFAPHLRPQSKRWWDALNDFWSGKKDRVVVD